MSTDTGYWQEPSGGRSQDFWDRFYKRWTKWLTMIVRVRLDGNEGLQNDVDDVVQYAWIRIFRGLPSCRWTGMATWMATTADRTALNYIRASRSRGRSEQLPTGDGGDDYTRKGDIPYFFACGTDGYSQVRHDEIWHEVCKLPELHRNAILGRVDGYSDDEMAAFWNVKPAAARKRVSRARALLSDRIALRYRGRRTPGHRKS